jgi:hypothetical protein
MIHDFPPDTDARLVIVRGLMALLPAHARPDLTFSTNRHEKTITQARVVFAPSSIVTGRWVANWAARAFPDDENTLAPYIKRLNALWKGDITPFLNAIDQMDSIAATLVVNRSLQNSLSVMAERHALDTQIQSGADVAPETLKAVMKDIPPQGEIKRLYARRLLRHALDARDAEAALIVARAMDEDPELDRLLYHRLQRELVIRPDAIYSFVRTRVGVGGTSGSPDPPWAERLKVAALASLRVAIIDGDAETVINWLKLIAREPAGYDLGEIVHNGILAAQERARTEPELAQSLVLLAVKRDPAALEKLLADDALLAAIPNTLGVALRGGQGDPLCLMQTYGVEVFLVALTRALATRSPDLFTSTTMELVWSIYTGASVASAPTATSTIPTVSGSHRATHIIDELASSGASWLPAGALETLLGAMLRDRRDDLSHGIIHQISRRPDFLAIFIAAISSSERSDSDSLALIAQRISVGDFTQQEAVDVYVGLLTTWEWRRSALEIMEQLARAIQQHPHLDVSTEVIWHLLGVSAEMKEELIARVALRRLTGDLDALDDAPVLVEDLQRLMAFTTWNNVLRAQLLTWWRGYVHEQTTAGLQRIDKAFSEALAESRHSLDDLRIVVQSVLAFRRMLGKRSLSQFADDVTTAYGILQGLAESFDPTPKRPINFDPATVRLEMDARAEELSPHELKILANNFKELAQLIATMADNRSKATLMRRGDDVDRQLMSGDQQPHSAVDALKWMAGYLSGTQEKDDTETE